MALSTIPNNMQAALTAAQMPAGAVIQVVQGTALGSVTSSSSSFVTTGVDVNITPQFASSKILLHATGCYDTEAGGRQMSFISGIMIILLL